MSGRLDGQVALVTGSGRGFGRSIALGLAREGAKVLVTARSIGEIEETAQLIKSSGGHALAEAGDITKRSDIEHLAQVAQAELGPVSLVIHNAGVPWPFGPTWYVDPDRWWEAQTVHVRASMYLINAFVPKMIERHFGRVILVSSTAAVRVTPNLSGYGVAKSTQVRLVQYLEAEAAEEGVHAFAIHPGSVLTGISDLTMADPDAQRFNPEFVARLESRKHAHEDGSEALEACARLCIDLGSGDFDDLAGRYLTPADDLAALRAAGGEVAGAMLGVVLEDR